MIFTDDDLKDLKDRLAKWPDIDVCNYFDDDTYINALIARLEAAEKVCNVEHTCVDETSYCCAQLMFAYEDWLKTAGK